MAGSNQRSGTSLSPAAYGVFLIFIAGMGGLLYGVDIGIISAALLYLGKTVNLTLAQTSVIVAAVLGGSMVSSLVAGFLADWLGRKTMMVVSAVMFVSSVGLIVLSQGFLWLFAGRLLQGMSGGVIAVVVPLYLAECLRPEDRGKGSAIFQLLLTVGLVIAAFAGLLYTRQAEAAIAAAAGNAALIRAAQDHAWRSMFLSVIYPGVVFFLGSLFLSESPRWLFRRGRREQALMALRRSSSEAEADTQMREMESLAERSQETKKTGVAGSLLQRKYVYPFVLACVILACNQTTGINSVLGYLVLILKQAGMSAAHATQGDVAVKLLNVVMTLVAVALVDRKGRKFLLVLGTSGIIVALAAAAIVFHGFEAQRQDVRTQVQSSVQGNTLHFGMADLQHVEQTAGVPAGSLPAAPGAARSLTVLYNYGSGEKMLSVLSTDSSPVIDIRPQAGPSPGMLAIDHAFYGPVPTERTGWLVALCIAIFVASFAIGPGVVVWLALSELMPTRIRSGGMGVALLLNQGASTLIAGVFLPVVGTLGYYAMFAFWALCTCVYFIAAAFFLPETKGKTLEEVEAGFDRESLAKA